jgi:hypothetical protein
VLVYAVKSRKVTESQVDESVRHVHDKFALGLFENRYAKEDPVAIRNVAREGKDLSRRLGAESVTLLKNDKNLLPHGVGGIESGVSKTVRFVVPMSLLAYTGISGEVVMEPGPVEVSAGSSPSDLRSNARLTVTGKTRVIKERAFLSTTTVAT